MKPRKNSKPMIEDIVISKEKLNELNSELGRKSTHTKPAIVRKYCGGTCTYCGEIPTKKLKYDVGDGDKLVEFYCDPCYQKHGSELGKRLQNINFA